MGKRSSKPRIDKGKYYTPLSALLPLLPHLKQPRIRFIEPCAGDGRLVAWLTEAGHVCTYACDVEPGPLSPPLALALRNVSAPLVHTADARKLDITDIPQGTTHAITNPPWPLPGGKGTPTVPILQNLLRLNLVTWLLLPADMMHNGYMVRLLLDHCEKIVSIGRVQWFPGTDYTAMDNCCWYQFVPWVKTADGGPTFIPKARFAHGKR